jgi:hypothetical protein
VSLRAEEDKWLIFRASADGMSRLRRGDHALFEIVLSADRAVDFRALSKGADHRVASIGVLGFMLCAEDDFASRLKFVESAGLGDLASLLAKPSEADFDLGGIRVSPHLDIAEARPAPNGSESEPAPVSADYISGIADVSPPTRRRSSVARRTPPPELTKKARLPRDSSRN